MSLPIAVLISGDGSNLQVLINKMEERILDVDIKMVLSNRENAYGLKRAQAYGIPTCTLSHKDFSSREEFDGEMVRVLKESGVEAVVMAGFMRIITPVFLSAFPGKIINIHPALLPAFPGVDGQGDASKYGVRLAGCTVHFVDEKMDHGAIIIQSAVPASPGEDPEDLRLRILEQEHRILPQATQWLAEGRLRIDGRFVKLEEDDVELAETDGTGLVNPPLEYGF
ncbi:phosphoribosylglycinamide formyltransferase [Maridesulfovibrio hydrothermalis]|uniref:Phosphoribosylglycinamide formyltransferase n=1 Tax=Maridesulfovibrio hydrothermalis AM13 = DSM 14728 TaxID=1121451 RepID=L0R996_9BACT|nr:phosphoribosylglycinamide formyltransferase [Maridesulfovibrio hydrothermalis]CCO22765.1 Phosphoribosylglycinamide formyltransferase [Maridesulfovibrio hydrothermalis AM13 = DSM 14728]